MAEDGVPYLKRIRSIYGSNKNRQFYPHTLATCTNAHPISP